MRSHDIRRAFVDFFTERDHEFRWLKLNENPISVYPISTTVAAPDAGPANFSRSG
jgi:hypothetical protein